MSDILLTQYSGAILGPIAWVLGKIMNFIYMGISFIGIENIGLAIILLTIIIYSCMIPLTINQQKFSMMSRKMNPELKAIQAKYKGKTDQASMEKMNQETQAVYAKYGTNPVGSCLPLLIQMPLLFANYRVMYNVPAYADQVKAEFSALVQSIMNIPAFPSKLHSFITDMNLQSVGCDFTTGDIEKTSNFVIDLFYKMGTNGWSKMIDLINGVSDSANMVAATPGHAVTLANMNMLGERMNTFNYFGVLNISDSPLKIIGDSWGQMISGGVSTFFSFSLVVLLCAILVPALSYGSQMLNIALMPQPDTGNDQQAGSMKMMNKIMPIFSLVMCFTVPVGLGIYWVASAVVRLVQQILINNYLKKHEDEIMEKNKIKAQKKLEKRGIYQERIKAAANMNTKKDNGLDKSMSSDQKKSRLQQAYEAAQAAQSKNPNSMTAKANLVKKYNEKNNK